jgi:hypothetical protein
VSQNATILSQTKQESRDKIQKIDLAKQAYYEMVMSKLEKRFDLVKVMNNKLKKQNQMLVLYGSQRMMLGSHLSDTRQVEGGLD